MAGMDIHHSWAVSDVDSGKKAASNNSRSPGSAARAGAPRTRRALFTLITSRLTGIVHPHR